MMLAWGLLEWTFVVILLGLTGAVGVAFLYIMVQLFLNPGRKSHRT